jgi:hypothetical protein
LYFNLTFNAATEQKKNMSWNSSASHITHQVGVSEVDAEVIEAEPSKDQQQSFDRQASVTKTSRVSFDEKQAEVAPVSKMQSVDEGNTRVSYEKPVDLYASSSYDQGATAATAATAADPITEVKVDASNTGTAKRKKKKRDEVGRLFSWSTLHSTFFLFLYILHLFHVSI